MPSAILKVNGIATIVKNADVIAPLELLQRDLQVDLALAPQQQLVGVAGLLIGDRGVLLVHALQRAGELDLVVAVLGRDRHQKPAQLSIETAKAVQEPINDIPKVSKKEEEQRKKVEDLAKELVSKGTLRK